MFSDRLLTIFEMMASRERSGVERGLLCAVAAEITGVDAAGIALASDDLPLTIFCASDALAHSLLELEITVGEGPCTKTLETDAIAAEPDFATTTESGWMFYTPQAVAAGARSAFGFPVRIGVIRLGVLCLYTLRPGDLSNQQSSDALLMASVVGRGIVALQAGAPPHALADELQREATFDFSVHQAAGMIAVQAALSIANALILLRMHAFSTTQSLAHISSRVISRQLRFDVTSQEWIGGN
jgi:GAF domain-containing protein